MSKYGPEKLRIWTSFTPLLYFTIKFGFPKIPKIFLLRLDKKKFSIKNFFSKCDQIHKLGKKVANTNKKKQLQDSLKRPNNKRQLNFTV